MKALLAVMLALPLVACAQESWPPQAQYQSQPPVYVQPEPPVYMKRQEYVPPEWWVKDYTRTYNRPYYRGITPREDYEPQQQSNWW